MDTKQGEILVAQPASLSSVEAGYSPTGKPVVAVKLYFDMTQVDAGAIATEAVRLARNVLVDLTAAREGEAA